MATETITLRLVAQDLMSGNVSKAVGKIDTLAKRGGIVGSVFQGVGQKFGQMLNPLGLVTQGVGMLTDVMMDGIKAAIEDEKAQEQLNQTIRANVKGWDENTSAIEDAIKAAAGLAFTDDEVREGLNQLIPRTKDIAEANRLNALAMDLARAKNLSLGEAATLVGKAYSGQASALRRAGVAIKDTKNGTKALAELQKMVSGQAEKYASTTEGSLAVLQITIDELVEALGYELLPYLKDFANYLRTDVIPNIDDATTAIHNFFEAAKIAGWALPQFGSNLGRFNEGLEETNNSAKGLNRTLAVPPTGTIKFWDTISDGAPEAIASINDVVRVVVGLPNTFKLAVVDMKSTIKEGKDGIVEQFRDLAWQTKHPFAEQNYADWLQRKYAKAGRLMKQAAKNGRPGIVAEYRQLREDIQLEMFALPDNLARVQRQINGILGNVFSAIHTAVGNVLNLGPSGGVEPRASGGSVEAGRTYVVGEKGPELLTMGRSSGSITPNHKISSGGASVNVNVTIIGSMSEADGQRFARTVTPHIRRELARSGG